VVDVTIQTEDGRPSASEPVVDFAEIGIIGWDRHIDIEPLRLYGLPEDGPAILFGCPSLPAGTRTLALETSWSTFCHWASAGQCGVVRLADLASVRGLRVGSHMRRSDAREGPISKAASP
jgi:hypothetical protein